MRRRLLVSCSLLWLLGTVPGFATGNIVKSDLKGTWRISVRGQTADCGFASMLATITFDTSGSGTGPLQVHGGCGDSTLPGQTLTVDTLSKTGTGTASMSCGAGCEWNFQIQVTPDRTKFNLVDVTPGNDYVEGLAILSSPADHIALADLKGDWTVVSVGRFIGECGDTPGTWPFSSFGSVTMNATGAGTTTGTSHTGCGDFDEPASPVSILSLNADGSGTIRIGDDEIEASIQVSPDRAIFNVVTLSAAGPDFFFAGVGIRRSTAGHISKTNLAGPWQGTLFSSDSSDLDVGTVLSTFKLNTKAQANNNMTVTLHGTEGDGTNSGLTLAILTLNPDGSGTARVSFEGVAEPDARIQVSPDRSMISVVNVNPDSNEFEAGVLIHQ
jgi:hypothetical protein